MTSTQNSAEQPRKHKQLKWYHKRGTTYEIFSVIYEDETFMLVHNENSGDYSFGTRNCFGTLNGFPVNWSCLTKEQAIGTLNSLLEIFTYSEPHKSTWRGMLNALNAA